MRLHSPTDKSHGTRLQQTSGRHPTKSTGCPTNKPKGTSQVLQQTQSASHVFQMLECQSKNMLSAAHTQHTQHTHTPSLQFESQRGVCWAGQPVLVYIDCRPACDTQHRQETPTAAAAVLSAKQPCPCHSRVPAHRLSTVLTAYKHRRIGAHQKQPLPDPTAGVKAAAMTMP